MQDLGSASDWLKEISQVVQHDQYIRRTTQIWVVMHHQYGISVLVSQMSIAGKPVVALRNVTCFLRLFNPLGPKSVQHQFSPNNISRSTRVKVMRITKLMTKGRIL